MAELDIDKVVTLLKDAKQQQSDFVHLMDDSPSG